MNLSILARTHEEFFDNNNKLFDSDLEFHRQGIIVLQIMHLFPYCSRISQRSQLWY